MSNTKTADDLIATPTNTNPNTITLETPIQRGEQLIETVTLRKPKAGNLRGISLLNLMQMETDAVIRVVPRISEPTLNAQDMDRLDTADLVQFGTMIAGFLLPKAVKEAGSLTV
ncbi:phage tail assembly protein [Chitinimonas sp. PSY-7]|uniref:phage tail assembly protein n=1 Tax=Chitinimonas sp. PSY-7 TaxID=3459088 RepID=UPI00403FDBA9